MVRAPSGRVLLAMAVLVAATAWASGAGAQPLIVADACAPDYCDNALVADPPLKILYRTTTATEPEFATDLPNLQRFAAAQNVSLVLERAAPESVRTTFVQLLESSLGPDVMQWQGIQVMQPSLYNLDAEAAAGNWSQLFSAQLLATVTAADGSLYGVPTLQRSWGIWYKKSALPAAGVAAFPVAWDDFLALLAALNASEPARAPLCISYGDGWQAQTWASFLIGRIGGDAAWQRLLSMTSDISSDPAVVEAWQRVAELLPYFQGGAEALTKTFADTLVDYVAQRCALVLSYGITRSFPAVLGADNDDYTWGAFPEVNGSLGATERGEFSGFLVWAVNSNARLLDAALAFVRLQASLEYQTQFVADLDGDLPAMGALFPLITDPEVRRCLAQLQAAPNLWNFIDVVQPTFALYEKPLTTAGFTGGLAPADMPQQWELVRQQQVLLTAVAPTYTLVGNLLVLTTYTPNASIWYSVGSGGDGGGDGGDAAQYLYVTPVELESGAVNDVSALTRCDGMLASGVVRWQISVGAQLVDGQRLADAPNVPLYVLAVCLALGGMWATVILVEQLTPAHFLWRHDPARALLAAAAAAAVHGLLRSSNDRRLARNVVLGWLALVVCAAAVTQWTASLAAVTAIVVPQLALVPTFVAIEFRLVELLTALLVPLLPLSLAFYILSARSVAVAQRLLQDRTDASERARRRATSGGGAGSEGDSGGSGSGDGSGRTAAATAVPESVTLGVKYAAAAAATATAERQPTAGRADGPRHRRHRNRWVRAFLRRLHSVQQRCDRHLAAGALLVTLSIACETFLVLQSLVLPCTIEYDAAHVLAALVVTWLLAVAGLLATFYYRAAALRPLAAVPMAGATVCMNFIVMAGAAFRFEPLAAASAAVAAAADSVVSASTVVDVSVVAAAVVVFALLAVNANRLKLSRDDFDRKYQVAGEKNARLEAEKEQYRAALVALQMSLVLIRNPLLSPLLIGPAAPEPGVATAAASPTAAARERKRGLGAVSDDDDDDNGGVAGDGDRFASRNGVSGSKPNGGPRRAYTSIRVSRHGAGGADASPPKAARSLPTASTGSLALQQVLDNPVAFEILRRQAIEGKAPEACDFLAAVKAFKTLDAGDPRAIRNVCDNIIDTFIATDRPSTVNFSATLALSVVAFAKKAAAGGGGGGAAQLLKTFDDCEAPARQLISGNEWPALLAQPAKVRACTAALAIAAHLHADETRQLHVDSIENATHLWAKLHRDSVAHAAPPGGTTDVVVIARASGPLLSPALAHAVAP